jgi:hypothetical protein
VSVLSAEVIEKLAGYIVNRRDKRLITLTVLILYAGALLYHFIGGLFGAPDQKAALDSIEALAMVVVVAHIAGAAAQRSVAQRAIAKKPPDPSLGPQP